MIRFLVFVLAAMLVAGEASAECVGGRCAVGVARVVTAPVRVVAPVARAAVVAPVRVVERVVETAAPVARAVVAAPVRVVQHVAHGAAQRHAERLAASGAFHHSGDRCGAPYEGLGFSTSSPDDACRRACYWGQRPVREIGTAWCRARNGWIAVVTYN